MNEVILPNGWAMATFGEVADGSVDRSGAASSEFIYVDISSVDREKKCIADANVIQSDEAPSRAKQVFQSGDVLVSMTRPNLNAVAIVSSEFDGSIGSTGFHVLRSRWVEPKFLFYLVQIRRFIEEMSLCVQGALYPAVRPKDIDAFGFFLPPLQEQHRIVAKIEELFSELGKGIENLKTARAQLKVYRQALLKHAFAGKGLTQNGIIAKPFGEEYFLTLGDVIQTLGQGWSPRCLETPSKSDDVWGVIRTTAIQPLHFDDTKNKQFPIGLTPRPHLEIIPGDVLITRAGPRTRVGIACFVKNTRPKLMVCDKAYRLRVHKEKILPQYLVMLLNTSEVLSELEKLKSGISDSGLNLTQDKFLTLKIMVPSLEHQQIILDGIEEKLTNVAFLETQIDDSLQQAEALRQSILKKAFSGQLVPQDPHDEPALALLARIKAERTTVAAKPRKNSTGYKLSPVEIARSSMSKES